MNKKSNKNYKEICPNFNLWNKQIENIFGKEPDLVCPICPDKNLVKGRGMIRKELNIHIFYKHGECGKELLDYCREELPKKADHKRKFVLNMKIINNLIKHAKLEMGLLGGKCKRWNCCCEFK